MLQALGLLFAVVGNEMFLQKLVESPLHFRRPVCHTFRRGFCVSNIRAGLYTWTFRNTPIYFSPPPYLGLRCLLLTIERYEIQICTD